MTNILKQIIPDALDNLKKYALKTIETPYEIRKKRQERVNILNEKKIEIDPLTKNAVLLNLPINYISRKDNKTYISIIDKINKLKNKIINKKLNKKKPKAKVKKNISRITQKM